MASLFRFLRPMAFLRRKAVYSGLLGGNRKWLLWGGAAWAGHLLRGLFGKGQPEPVFTRELDPGDRFVVVHSPAAPKQARRVRRRR